MEHIIEQEKVNIEDIIYEIRGKQVMLDRDLAKLYQVETRTLNQKVKRNIERFPEDFCFQMTELEFENWRSQIVMSRSDKLGLRRPPYVFTEQGIAMLSWLLRHHRGSRCRRENNVEQRLQRALRYAWCKSHLHIPSGGVPELLRQHKEGI